MKNNCLNIGIHIMAHNAKVQLFSDIRSICVTTGLSSKPALFKISSQRLSGSAINKRP
ncbi:MAG: hypothetical protein ACI8ZV_000491 [Chitinophagales bacterium]|jgi:hypothetical protein